MFKIIKESFNLDTYHYMNPEYQQRVKYFIEDIENTGKISEFSKILINEFGSDYNNEKDENGDIYVNIDDIGFHINPKDYSVEDIDEIGDSDDMYDTFCKNETMAKFLISIGILDIDEEIQKEKKRKSSEDFEYASEVDSKILKVLKSNLKDYAVYNFFDEVDAIVKNKEKGYGVKKCGKIFRDEFYNNYYGNYTSCKCVPYQVGDSVFICKKYLDEEQEVFDVYCVREGSIESFLDSFKKVLTYNPTIIKDDEASKIIEELSSLK